MIEIFKYNGYWRIKITSETLEFKTLKEFEKELSNIIALKERAEPYPREVIQDDIRRRA